MALEFWVFVSSPVSFLLWLIRRHLFCFLQWPQGFCVPVPVDAGFLFFPHTHLWGTLFCALRQLFGPPTPEKGDPRICVSSPFGPFIYPSPHSAPPPKLKTVGPPVPPFPIRVFRFDVPPMFVSLLVLFPSHFPSTASRVCQGALG